MKKYLIKLNKVFSVPFICYVYANNKKEAYSLYQKECLTHAMLHYSYVSKSNLKKIGKTNKNSGLELVHI